jgi:hypothetical protein
VHLPAGYRPPAPRSGNAQQQPEPFLPPAALCDDDLPPDQPRQLHALRDRRRTLAFDLARNSNSAGLTERAGTLDPSRNVRPQTWRPG